jgi:zinc finger protein
MGGRFTTVEGILENIKRDLRAQVFGLDDNDNPVSSDKGGDSMTSESQRTWDEFFASVGEAIAGKRQFTLVLEDPLAASYVQSFTAPEPDPQIHIEEYERTEEEMEDLGLKDIKTENYAQEQ